MKRFESNRHELETSDAANIMKHTQGSFDEQHRIHSSYHGQSSHQRQVSDDAAASSSYSEMASFTNSAPAEEIPFDCRDQDFTMKQLDFLEDEFVYWESLQPLRLWYISCALKVPEWMVERWFEIRRKSIKQTSKRKFPTSASNTQSTGRRLLDLEEEPKKPSRKRWAYSDEQNAGLQVAYDESRFLTNERTIALAIYFVIPVRRVENWFHNRTRTRRGAYLKQKRLDKIQQNKQSTSSSSLAALPSSHIHRQDPSQQDGNELDYLDGNLTKKIDQSNELAPLDVYDVIHVLGDQQDDANEPI
ncbi:uncharacterized protein LOC143460070 isoform X1 [Clavelina lepadiformis]|uniref:uncharacterized protein LOC143460070 isoform X1 n=1 Tax=Clavelina lepadiformis TaxID=159417 RepID=UPI0040437621